MLNLTLHHHRTDDHTRLNSIPSVRTSQLSTSRNLRLRTSEIALASQLKKEKEKSQRIMTDAESAVRFHHFYFPYSLHPKSYFLPAGAFMISFHYRISFGHEPTARTPSARTHLWPSSPPPTFPLSHSSSYNGASLMDVLMPRHDDLSFQFHDLCTLMVFSICHIPCQHQIMLISLPSADLRLPAGDVEFALRFFK